MAISTPKKVIPGYTGGLVSANGSFTPPVSNAPSHNGGILGYVTAPFSKAINVARNILKTEVLYDPRGNTYDLKGNPINQVPTLNTENDIPDRWAPIAKPITVATEENPSSTSSVQPANVAPELVYPDFNSSVISKTVQQTSVPAEPANNPLAPILNPKLQDLLEKTEFFQIGGIEKILSDQITTAEDKAVEYVLRDALTHKFMLAFAQMFKEGFTNGNVDFNSFQYTGDQLRALQWGKGNRQHPVPYDPKVGLLVETFGFNIATARANVLRDNQTRSNQQNLDQLAQNQMQTLEWAEQQLNMLMPPVLTESHVVTPSAPPQEEEPAPIATSSTPANLPQTTPATAISTPAAVVVKRIPYVSYIDVAYKDALEKSDSEAWKALPELVKRDAILHSVFIGSIGKAEKVAERVLTTTERLNKSSNKIPSTKIGQSVLNYFYSDKIAKDYLTFANDLKALPLEKEPLFLQYVRELAEKAGIQIADWDRDWAFHHWKNDEILPISLQALERFIHTS